MNNKITENKIEFFITTAMNKIGISYFSIYPIDMTKANKNLEKDILFSRNKF